MNEEFFKMGEEMVKEGAETLTYREYLRLGGIINEEDYNNALTELNEPGATDEKKTKQVRNMAELAGIALDDEDFADKLAKLYTILRSDFKPADVQHHHSTMHDHQIMVEALRMLGDSEAINKMIKAYPNISFDYKRSGGK